MANKKAILYDPYLDTLGGGERYFLTVAQQLLSQNYSVTILWPQGANFITEAKKRFGLSLSQIKIIQTDISKINILQKFFLLSRYDLSFFITDGSLPFLFAKTNYIHAQIPFILTNPRPLNFLKLKLIKYFICNSKFTENQTRLTYKTQNTKLLYPPIEPIQFPVKLDKKEKIILSVARFTNLANNKRQDILINAFKMLSKINHNYQLILAGGNHDPNNIYLKKIKSLSANYPIKFIENPSNTEINKLYSRAEIFWHAAGYGINENKEPEKTEHFGMSIVEAMSNGCLVFAIGKGGIKEIIDDKVNGIIWQNENELVSKTNYYINTKTEKNIIQNQAIKYSARYSRDNFNKSLTEILK